MIAGNIEGDFVTLIEAEAGHGSVGEEVGAAEEGGSSAEFGKFAAGGEVAGVDDDGGDFTLGAVFQDVADGDGEGPGNLIVMGEEAGDLVGDGDAGDEFSPPGVARVNDAAAEVGV